MAIQETMMRFNGKVYELIYKIPGIGPKLVRYYNRGLGKFIFLAPGSGAERQESIEGVKQNLIDMSKMMKLPIYMSDNDVGPDCFEFFVDPCPYGYHREDQQGVCDAAMDMDRTMFKNIGAELIIKESIPEGAPKCRIWMKWIDK